jgi:hypothetical protein
MAAALGQTLGGLDEAARPFGVFLDIHILPSTLDARSCQHADSDALTLVNLGLDMGRWSAGARVAGATPPGIKPSAMEP